MESLEQKSYFRHLPLKLSLPVLVGSGILILYYGKLFHLNAEQIKKSLYFAVIALPISLLWPIPFNRRFLRPIIGYLKGTAASEDAEKAAAAFPTRSAFMSLFSWTLAGIAIVAFSIYALHIPASHRFSLFMAAISGGLAASFVHFHIVRAALEPIRHRIAEETGRISTELRYPILMKLLGSFTMLIVLSLIFFALMESTHTQEALQKQGVTLLQTQLESWKAALDRDRSATAFLPAELTIQRLPPEAKGDQDIVVSERIADGRYLVAHLPAPSYQILVGSAEWEAAGVILLTVLIGVLISYFAASDISKPLNQIREATRRIASGDFDQRLATITDDEVAELAQSINAMAANLREKIDLLQKARDMAQEKSTLLEEANQELMKLDELKSNFLANVSHELKAPLVSTKGYIDFILSEKLGSINEKQRKGLAVSRDNLTHLSRLITSLLDFSKITSGMLKLRMDSFSLRQIIESCIETVKVEVKQKNKEMEFTADLPPELPMVYADPDRIREVIMNLLINAEKFTPPAGRVKVSVTPPKPEADFVTISVIDNGIGIPKDHLNKIFNRFYQVDGSSTRKYGGTGLGLAIVREILEAHRCKIHVESDEGIGSKFTFDLPVFRQVSDATVLQTRKKPGKHHASKLVEVVEDDPNIATIVKMLLEEEGFAVIQAPTGKDALMIAREHKPDLITLDVYLPDINGFDLLKQLQDDPYTSDIPVIVLSILMDKEKGFQLGASDYLEKPIDEEKLRESVQKISKALDGSDGVMKIMVVDDDLSTLEFFQDCLSVEGYQVFTVSEGREALANAKKESPNLILLDLVMPDVEGLEVLRRLKSDPATQKIPVIVLTGKGRMEDRDQSLKLGADEFLAKPFELREIVNQVKKYFEPL